MSPIEDFIKESGIMEEDAVSEEDCEGKGQEIDIENLSIVDTHIFKAKTES